MDIRPVFLAFALGLGLWLGAAPTHAQDDIEEEIVALIKQLDEDAASLVAADCAAACKALAAMIRSANRICELEPGPRCDDARKKVADAKKQVREHCPDCKPAQTEDVHGHRDGHQHGKKKDDEPRPVTIDVRSERPTPMPASPPGDDAGCASCAVGYDDGAPPWLALIGLAAAAAIRRRRRAS